MKNGAVELAPGCLDHATHPQYFSFFNTIIFDLLSLASHSTALRRCPRGGALTITSTPQSILAIHQRKIGETHQLSCDSGVGGVNGTIKRAVCIVLYLSIADTQVPEWPRPHASMAYCIVPHGSPSALSESQSTSSVLGTSTSELVPSSSKMSSSTQCHCSPSSSATIPGTHLHPYNNSPIVVRAAGSKHNIR